MCSKRFSFAKYFVLEFYLVSLFTVMSALKWHHRPVMFCFLLDIGSPEITVTQKKENYYVKGFLFYKQIKWQLTTVTMFWVFLNF